MIFSLFSVRAHQIARLVRARRLRTRRSLMKATAYAWHEKCLTTDLVRECPNAKFPAVKPSIAMINSVTLYVMQININMYPMEVHTPCSRLIMMRDRKGMLQR